MDGNRNPLNWRCVGVIAGVMSVVILFAVVDLRCRGSASDSRVAREMMAGKQAQRERQAEDLAQMARDLRILAVRYREKGEKKKAYHALSAAQELDKKIKLLRGGL